MELCGDKHGGNSEQLELVQRHSTLAQISINDIHCDKKRFWEQIKLHLDDNKPVNEGLTLLSGDIRLHFEVGGISLEYRFAGFHPDVNLVAIWQILVVSQQICGVVSERADQLFVDLWMRRTVLDLLLGDWTGLIDLLKGLSHRRLDWLEGCRRSLLDRLVDDYKTSL